MTKLLLDIVDLTEEYQVYEGNLESVFGDITRILGKRKKTRQDYSTLAFQSPRIIRALVDYKDQHPKNERVFELLRESITVALNLYKNYDDPTVIDDVIELKREILELDEEIIKTKVQQYPDFINLLASKPEFSRKAAKKLYDLVESENAIMLAIGHGGINVGMDVVLRHESLSRAKNVLFYPVRFSRTKHKKYRDAEPKLTPHEIKYLQKQARGKRIIIFDENCNTGKTMKQVVKYVSQHVFPKHRIDTLYNIDTSRLGE